MEEFNDRIYKNGITWLFGHHCLECGHLTFAQHELKELAKYFYEAGQGKYKEESSSESTTLNYKGSIDNLEMPLQRKVMKANEAPEKIYLEKVYPDNGVLPNGLNYNQSPDDIEYTRTDAFIEKAIAWWEDNFVYTDDVDEKYKNIDDFKNYMKGE